MKYIAWLDDEIETLKPLINLVDQTGKYKVYPFNRSEDFFEFLKEKATLIDVIILDEHIGYESGLDIYDKLRERFNLDIPVIFITQEEDSTYIRELISRGVQRYISKPVKFSDLLAAITQITEGESLRKAHLVSQIPMQFRNIYTKIEKASSITHWHNIISDLIRAEPLLGKDLFYDLYDLAQRRFFEFFVHNYENFVSSKDSALVVNFLSKYESILRSDTLVLVIDNFSLWVWEMVKNSVEFPEGWELYNDEFLLSLLPSVTQYSRQSLLSGFFPNEIKEMNMWVGEAESRVKTQNETELIKLGFANKGLPDPEVMYFHGEQAFSKFKGITRLAVIVVSFFDQLVHIATDHKSLREIFPSMKGFAEVIKSSFREGVIGKILSESLKSFQYVIICSDHGSVFVKEPVYVTGRHFMPLNLRYKYGEDFKIEEDDFVAFFADPFRLKLPLPKHFKIYFAGKDRFFVRKQGNYKEIIERFTGSLQHGGISLEEIFVPVIILRKKY